MNLKNVRDNLYEMMLFGTSPSKRASPTVFVSEKDETLLFCVAQRKFNVVTLWDPYLLRRMDKWVNFPTVTRELSTMDAKRW